MAYTDRDMIKAMLEGDDRAFETVYRQFHMDLYRVAYLISGNKADSEDIMQETFVTIYLHRKELKEPERFEKWAMKILVRKAFKALKGKRKEASLEGIAEDTEAEVKNERLMENKNVVSPQDKAIESIEYREVLEAVRSLPKKLRTATVLYYYKDYSIKEIAEATGCFEGTVKSRLYKSRKILFEKLGDFKEGRL